ncbi:hypothetical protein PBI_SMARTIES_9 [Microbacterium phage Smarties]|uniref:Uncharacterized protein n=1 Tax=Microbacterium phage Ariadne TaxID=2656546 RepID=A0A649VB34_9CAUD|nr:hypothetical protein QDA10_gp009 [Microbacterium phage Ariadne]QGJ89414.1 hypothetical protein PBI_ARIADNE_9 [Microbacterium phage Ariadne]QGJ91401.1 hypothetical protein PBI_SMARTIES_9 [Microbacterium phage Smarties]
MTLIAARVRRAPHPETLTVPAKFVVHRDVNGSGRWEVHAKDSPYCEVTHPGWSGNEPGGCLGLSVPRGDWARAVAEAHARSSAARLAFRDRLQARGRFFS